LAALKSQYISNSGDGETWGDRLTAMQNEIRVTNPCLVEFIELQVGKFPRELHVPMFEVIIGTLVLLERQMQSDAMRKSFPRIEPDA
jgi:hypothetical protein